jgi:hypothetical protein
MEIRHVLSSNSTKDSWTHHGNVSSQLLAPATFMSVERILDTH